MPRHALSGDNGLSKITTPLTLKNRLTITSSNMASYFSIANIQPTTDLSQKPLTVKVDRSINELETDELSIILEIWVSTPRFDFPICKIPGHGKKIDSRFELIFESSIPADSNTSVPIKNSQKEIAPLMSEIDWQSDPKFGYSAQLEIVSADKEVSIPGPEPTAFQLPSFSFGQMDNGRWGFNDQYSLSMRETLTFSSAGKVKSIPQSCGKINAIWGTLKKMALQEIRKVKEESGRELAGLGYEISGIDLRGHYDHRSQPPMANPKTLETLVLHSITAQALSTEPKLNKTPEQQVENVERMMDWRACVEVWKLINSEMGLPRVSAHYIISRDGNIVELLQPKHCAHHAGGANRNLIGRGNAETLGIELVGFADDFRKSIIKTYRAKKASEDIQDRQWAFAFERLVKAHDPNIAADSHDEADFINEESPFYHFTDAQYEALNILIRVLGQRFGYIRLCTHQWLKERVEKIVTVKGIKKKRIIPGKMDPGTKFDRSRLTTLIPGSWAGEPGSFDSEHVYMCKGYEIEERRPPN